MPYYRCQNKSCGRKWHSASLEYERKRMTKPPSDLFAAPKESHKDGCPSCGGVLKPESGTFYEDIA